MFTPNEYGLFSMPTLETPRLTLRRMTMKDAKDVFEYSRDADVARHVLWSAQKDIGEAKDYCRYMTRRYRADEPSSWGIVDKKTGRLVGTIGYMNYDMDNASVEIGYSLAKWMWNGGYMTEALRRVIDYTFDAMDINRIEAQHELDNPVLLSVSKLVTPLSPEWRGTPSELHAQLADVPLLTHVLTRHLNANADLLYNDYGILYKTKRSHANRIIILTLEKAKA